MQHGQMRPRALTWCAGDFKGPQKKAILPMSPAKTNAETMPTGLARPWSGPTSAHEQTPPSAQT